MGTVRLCFPPTAGHVRTARLVAAAVARRAGLDGVRLDELRLAVGEACARAVRRCGDAGVGDPVELRVEDDGPSLFVTVVDGADTPAEDDPLVLALLGGLAETLELEAGPGGPGGTVRLGWLVGPAP